MVSKKMFFPAVLIFSIGLSSCGLIGALGRTANRSMAPRGIDEVSRGAMFESLRQIDAELDGLDRRGEDSEQ